MALIAADLPGTGATGAGRTDVGLDPDRAARIHPDGDRRLPGWRTPDATVFVSTHLISEFEGLIDEFTIIDRGREVLTLEADAARGRFEKPLEEMFISTLAPGRGAPA